MAKQLTIRNISSRPLQLNFENDTVNILPGKVSKPILQSEFDVDTVANAQLQKYIKDREVRVTTTDIKVATKKQS